MDTVLTQLIIDLSIDWLIIITVWCAIIAIVWSAGLFLHNAYREWRYKGNYQRAYWKVK